MSSFSAITRTETSDCKRNSAFSSTRNEAAQGNSTDYNHFKVRLLEMISFTEQTLDNELVHIMLHATQIILMQQAKVCVRSTGYLLVQACPGKVWVGELIVTQ